MGICCFKSREEPEVDQDTMELAEVLSIYRYFENRHGHIGPDEMKEFRKVLVKYKYDKFMDYGEELLKRMREKFDNVESIHSFEEFLSVI